jgi:hypothetical protein
VDRVRPSLVGLVASAYRDTGRALWALRDFALTAGLIGMAHSLAGKILYTPGFARATGDTGRLVADLVLSAGWIFLLVPFTIAVHRFVLLGETPVHYLAEPRHPRILRFYGSWLALSLVAAIPVALAVAGLAAARLLDWWVWPLLLPLVALPVVLCLRMTLLFPAIAVDAPGATWPNAYQDTRGHSIGICLLYAAAIVPAIVAEAFGIAILQALTVALLAALAAAGAPMRAIAVLSTLTGMAIMNALYVCSVALMVVIASRLYRLLGDRVRRLSEPQSA